MKPFHAILASAAFVAIGASSHADPAPLIHYAPAENLEHIDVELIESARRDFAAYVLTDWLVMQSLTHAADRGVKAALPGRHPVCRARAGESLPRLSPDARR